MPKITVTKNGKSCSVEMKETDNGFKVKTIGKDCKKLMGKDYFEKAEMEID